MYYASIIHKPIRISLYVEIYLYFFVVFKICMYTILVLLFLSFYTFVDVHIYMHHTFECVHFTRTTKCNTIQMQNQVVKLEHL